MCVCVYMCVSLYVVCNLCSLYTGACGCVCVYVFGCLCPWFDVLSLLKGYICFKKKKKKKKKTQIIVKLDNVLYDEKWSLRIKIYKKLENITFLSGSLRQKQLNSLFHGLNLLWFLASPFDNNTDFTYTHFFFLLFVFSNISFF